MTDMTLALPMTGGSKLKGRRKRRGLTVVETSLVMGIVLALLIVLYFGFQALRESQRNAALSSQVMRIVNQVETLYASSAAVDNGDLLPVLMTTGQFSEREIFLDNGDPVMVNSWDTEMDVAGAGGRDFTVTVNDVEPSACQAVAVAFIEGVREPDAVTINGAATALSVANINGACDQAQNDVVFTF